MWLCWSSERQLLWEEEIRRMEVEVRVGKLKNRKAAAKDEVTREMIKGGGNRVLEAV